MKLRFARLALAARGLGLLLLATCVGDIPTSSSLPSAPLAPPISAATTATSSALLIGAGEIARCDRTNDEATGQLLNNYPNATVFTLGDNINGSASLTDYTNCYGPSWGPAKARTRPSVGEKDYKTAGAGGFFKYFGAAGGDSAKYYYSYDLGAWHIIVLNDKISMAAGSPQETWLRGNLASNTKECTLAYWHHPRFSSYGGNNLASVKPLWDALYASRVDVVMNAAYVGYERFAPQTPTAVADANGIREFIVGTGGQDHKAPGSPKPNSEVRNGTTYGVLKLTLDEGSYAWEFVPVPGGTFADAGSNACHRRSTVASVDVTPASADMTVNTTLQLTATPKDAAGNPISGRVVTWASSNATVAAVDANGLVTGTAVGGPVTITATSEGKSGTSAITVSSASAVLVGAGDIAQCTSSGDEATANLLDGIPGTVFTVGDNAYESGTPTEFANCYEPSWGRHKARTRPTVGNHEYQTPGASGYFAYYGAAAGDPAKGYYSYDLGDWHVVVLNNYVPMSAGSAQEQWLRADLAASTKQCTVAMWHEPLFSSGPIHGGNLATRPLWQALYDWGAELVLVGHDHNYERFVPMRVDGTVDLAYGVREFVVGTGGATPDGEGHDEVPGSEVRGEGWGVMKLTLQASGYSWQFIPVPGVTFTDQGSGSCHGAPPPVANPGGPYRVDGTVTFNGSASFDPQGDTPLTYAWNFGDGITGSGATPTHTYAGTGDYTVTLVVTDAKGNPSAPATTTATIGNQPPSVNAGPDWSIIEGETVNLSATFTDNSSDTPWTYTISWGDGSATEGGTASSAGSPITSSHTYASPGQYTLQVSVTDQRGATGSDNAIVNVAEATAPRVLVGAGDITRCDRTDDEATAALLDNISGTVFTIGDNVMGNSTTVPDFPNCYDPSWGRHKARTHPAPGHMEYWVTGAASYFDYFGAAAGEAGKGYYSYDLGAWHVIVLNSNLGTSVGSAQELWLQADLAASTQQCTVAIWHLPRFSSAGTGYEAAAKPLWDDLYAAGAELVLNAHDEVYERFAPQTPDGVADPTGGIRQFTVGTGGIGSNPFGTIQPNSEVRSSGTPGVLKLTLATTGYSWQFVPIAGRTFTDSGSGSCH